MSIDPALVRHVARLARLAITPEEVPQYAGQLSRILERMEQLNQLSTQGILPLSHAVETTMPERPDGVVTPADGSSWHEAILACSPQSEQGHFRVPKIIE